MNATTFINPYNFVPVKNKVDRRTEFNRQEKFQGYSGKMIIRLTTLTPLFIPDRRQATHKQDEEKFFWREQLFDAPNKPKLDSRGRPLFHPHYARFFENAKGDKIIPGSSLKGMLRSVAEALSDSCFGLDTETFKDHGEHQRAKCVAPLPEQKERAGEGLCPCCRIFGYVHASASGRKDEDEGQRNFKGRVMVYDAVLADGSKDKIKPEEHRLKELSSPKSQHGPFYFDDPNQSQIRGRKFYYHHAAEPENFTTKDKTQRNCTIHECILRAAVFKFELHFENLSREELGLLLCAIRLNGVNNQKDENFMAHKVGMAKPLGFGSVQLVIENLTLFENDAAYRKFDAPDQQAYSDEGEAATKELAAFLASLAPRQNLAGGFANPFPNAGDAYDVWKFPRAGEVRYPEMAWFRHPVGRSLPLPKDGELPIISELYNAGFSGGKEEPKTSAGAAGATHALGEHLQKPKAAPAKIAESQNPVFEVEVLKRVKSSNKVIVKIDQAKHEIVCSDNRIQAGDKIPVKRQNDKSYKWQPRR